ncbi:DEAD/DEAH box RNA helicase [Achlya hypogyna]|uniref:RNA helicase n=1 Tax=Achlya hypogyna TaxID=1202772 RepID=A0A1V9ZUP6_ACHHY|nr:DEAD/DEAH box RNA helicase [Achlya hypogyna]
MDAFQSLQQGASFNTKRFKADISLFKGAKNNTSLGHGVANTNIGELDFFGCNAPAPAPAPKKVHQRERTSSVDVPKWAGGGAPEPKHKIGSKQRRKRKLSEDAAAQEKVAQADRLAASRLLAPSTKAKKTKPSNRAVQSPSDSSSAEEESDEADGSDASDDDQASNDDASDDETVNVFGKAVATNDSHPAPSSHSDDIKQLRKRLNISTWGTAVPDPIVEFAEMKGPAGLRGVVLANIEASQYKNPTPIQMQAIPAALQGRDVLGIAPTGSGKTAAFAIPMLLNLEAPRQDQGIRSIVLVPTRELAVQIHGEFQRLAHGRKFHISLLSKASAATMASHAKACTVNYDVVIATPLRLVHLITESKVALDTVNMICLDEADRLFEMGFVEQIDEVFAACTNPSLQRMMFSATMLEGVEDMAQSVLKDPIKIAIGTKNAGANTITQRLLFVGKEEGKLVAMKQLVQEGLKLPVLMFVQNKDRAKELYQELMYDGINVGAIHADRTKEQRDKVIKDFRTGSVWVLICTDLMARGIDFKGVNMVINYDFPQSAVSYIHRIGRTGRNGRQGEAVTFFTESDMVYLRTIANVMKLSGCDVPDWMLSMKKASVRQRKQLLKAPPQRHRIKTVSGYDLKKAHKKTLMKQHTAQKKAQASTDDEP